MRETDESAVVERARCGDIQAFELLYRRWVSPIYSLSLKMSGSSELAEDLTQEVFITAWEKLPLFNDRSSFFTWLYRLAVRVIMRKRSREHHYIRSSQPIESISGVHQEGRARYDASDKIDLQRSIARLPVRTRAALVLFDIEGYSHGEISRILGIREGTSKALVSRGRKQLARELLV